MKLSPAVTSRAWLACVLLLTGVCTGQSAKPFFTHTLHAHKERRNGFTLAPVLTLPSTVFVLAPDNSLVLLIPQEDGEWVLKSVTDWSTSVPREQTLPITGEKVGDQQIWVTGDLAINPDATDAFVRLTYRQESISLWELNAMLSGVQTAAKIGRCW